MHCTFCTNDAPYSGYCNRCFERLYWCKNHHDDQGHWSCVSCSEGTIHDPLGFAITRTIPSTIRIPHRDIGVVTWNIHDFADGPYKREFIQAAFARNPWLDVMALQEALPGSDLAISGLTVVAPLSLVAVTPREAAPKNEKNAKSFVLRTQVPNLPDDIANLWVQPSEREIYPLIFRRGADIRVHACWASYGGRRYDGKELHWCKRLRWRKKWNLFSHEKQADIEAVNRSLPEWRPIIVYELTIRGVRVNVAVVHTTPRGSGFGRKEEYDQVVDLLRNAGNSGQRWIILGDYYLDPEASINSKSEPKHRDVRNSFETAVRQHGLELVVTISATNQSSVKGVKEATLNRAYSKEGKVVVNKCADMLVCSRLLAKRHVAGILDPHACFIRIDPDHKALNYWAKSSDHLPMAALMCLDDEHQSGCHVGDLLEVAPVLELLASKDLWKRKQESLLVLERCLSELSYGLCYYHVAPWSGEAAAIEAICVLVYFTLSTYGQHPVVLADLEVWIAKHNGKTQEEAIFAVLEKLADRHDPRAAIPSTDPMHELYRACFEVRRALNVLEQGTGMYDPTSESLAYGPPPNPIVFQYDGLNVRQASRDTLLPGAYVDDDVMLVYLRWLSNSYQERFRGPSPFCLVPPAMAYMIVRNENAPAAAQQLLHVIGSARWVFLPINDNPTPDEVGGTHWTLLVWDRQTNSFTYLDTLNVGNGLGLVNRIKGLLGLTGVGCKHRQAPQQTMPDCGVFVMMLIRSICDALLAEQDPWDFGKVPAPSRMREVLLEWMTNE